MIHRHDKLRSEKAIRRLSNAEIADLADCSETTVRKAVNGESVHPTKLAAIGAVLGFSLQDLYEPLPGEAAEGVTV